MSGRIYVRMHIDICGATPHYSPVAKATQCDYWFSECSGFARCGSNAHLRSLNPFRGNQHRAILFAATIGFDTEHPDIKSCGATWNGIASAMALTHGKNKSVGLPSVALIPMGVRGVLLQG